MNVVKKIWEKEWVKIMTPVYGEFYIMRQPTGGHSYGYEKGFVLLGIALGKYGIPFLATAIIATGR